MLTSDYLNEHNPLSVGISVQGKSAIAHDSLQHLEGGREVGAAFFDFEKAFLTGCAHASQAFQFAISRSLAGLLESDYTAALRGMPYSWPATPHINYTPLLLVHMPLA